MTYKFIHEGKDNIYHPDRVTSSVTVILEQPDISELFEGFFGSLCAAGWSRSTLDDYIQELAAELEDSEGSDDPSDEDFGEDDDTCEHCGNKCATDDEDC